MAEKLIVKNFGPIKNVEIEIKKINVLIGDQGTGKSTLAKLYAALNDAQLYKNSSYTLFLDILDNYSIKSYLKPSSYIHYTDQSIDIEISKKKISVKLSEDFNSVLTQMEDMEGKITKFLAKLDDDKKNKKIPTEVIDRLEIQMLYYLSSLPKLRRYIPSERFLISAISNSLFSFINNKISLAQYITNFGEHYQFIVNKYKNFNFDFLNLKFFNDPQNGDYIEIDKSKTKLSESASGYQSILPLLISLQYYQNEGAAEQLIIEEPELNLFPATQNKLIKYMIGALKNDHVILLTTHSPYILSSLNNLMFAYEVGKLKPRKTRQIIDKNLWLNPENVSAYMLSDGFSEDIMDYEIMQIKAEKIDAVSRDINKEYDAMLDIKYAKN